MLRIDRVIAVDGPSGGGKSTVSRAVAEALGWTYLDTGATYRAATLAALRAGLLQDRAVIAGREADLLDVVRGAQIRLVTDPRTPGVRLGDEDVSAEIRGGAVTEAVSAVSAEPEVRGHLVALQQQLIGAGEAVVEGRDICTVVAPDAAVKVYLFADPEVRAARRAAELGHTSTAAVDLARRDALDAGRASSPAVRPDGAHPVDASLLTADEVIAVVLDLARQAGFTPPSPSA